MYVLKLIVVNYMISSNLRLFVPDDTTEILFVSSTENSVHDRNTLSKIFKVLNKTLKWKTIRKPVVLIINGHVCQF